jgi:hypothetical protein
MQLHKHPTGPGFWIERQRGEEMLGADVAEAGPARQAGRSGQCLASLWRLWWRKLTRLA